MEGPGQHSDGAEVTAGLDEDTSGQVSGPAIQCGSDSGPAIQCGSDDDDVSDDEEVRRQYEVMAKAKVTEFAFKKLGTSVPETAAIFKEFAVEHKLCNEGETDHVVVQLIEAIHKDGEKVAHAGTLANVQCVVEHDKAGKADGSQDTSDVFLMIQLTDNKRLGYLPSYSVGAKNNMQLVKLKQLEFMQPKEHGFKAAETVAGNSSLDDARQRNPGARAPSLTEAMVMALQEKAQELDATSGEWRQWNRVLRRREGRNGLKWRPGQYHHSYAKEALGLEHKESELGADGLGPEAVYDELKGEKGSCDFGTVLEEKEAEMELGMDKDDLHDMEVNDRDENQVANDNHEVQMLEQEALQSDEDISDEESSDDDGDDEYVGPPLTAEQVRTQNDEKAQIMYALELFAPLEPAKEGPTTPFATGRGGRVQKENDMQGLLDAVIAGLNKEVGPGSVLGSVFTDVAEQAQNILKAYETNDEGEDHEEQDIANGRDAEAAHAKRDENAAARAETDEAFGPMVSRRSAASATKAAAEKVVETFNAKAGAGAAAGAAGAGAAAAAAAAAGAGAAAGFAQKTRECKDVFDALFAELKKMWLRLGSGSFGHLSPEKIKVDRVLAVNTKKAKELLTFAVIMTKSIDTFEEAVEDSLVSPSAQAHMTQCAAEASARVKRDCAKMMHDKTKRGFRAGDARKEDSAAQKLQLAEDALLTEQASLAETKMAYDSAVAVMSNCDQARRMVATRTSALERKTDVDAGHVENAMAASTSLNQLVKQGQGQGQGQSAGGHVGGGAPIAEDKEKLFLKHQDLLDQWTQRMITKLATLQAAKDGYKRCVSATNNPSAPAQVANHKALCRAKVVEANEDWKEEKKRGNKIRQAYDKARNKNIKLSPKRAAASCAESLVDAKRHANDRHGKPAAAKKLFAKPFDAFSS